MRMIAAIVACVLIAGADVSSDLAVLDASPLRLTPVPLIDPYLLGLVETRKQRLARVFTNAVIDHYWLADLEALQNAWANGRVVTVPDDPTTGFVLRTSGRWPIAEKEPSIKRKQKYLALAPAALELLHQIAEYVRAEEGTSFQPLELTSLVRTWEYQLKLMKTNPTADVKAQGVPATHVLALAFDITRLTLTAKREQILHNRLWQLRKHDLIEYFVEGSNQAAFHVVLLPHAEKQYAQAYKLRQNVAYANTIEGR